MAKQNKQISVVEDPQPYFSQRARALDELLDQVEVSNQTKSDAKARATGKSARDVLLDALPFGGVVSKILSWNEQVNDEIEAAKRDHLLLSYINKSLDQDEAIAQLKKLITSPEGNLLFNKVLWILDGSPPDSELSGHLAAALSTIAKSDFLHLFEDHRFALGTMGRLTPAALSVLADFSNWPSFSMTLLHTQGRRVSNDWVPEFSRKYAETLRLEISKIHRLQSSVAELRQANLTEAETTGDKNVSVKLTPNGIVVARYVDA